MEAVKCMDKIWPHRSLIISELTEVMQTTFAFKCIQPTTHTLPRELCSLCLYDLNFVKLRSDFWQTQTFIQTMDAIEGSTNVFYPFLVRLNLYSLLLYYHSDMSAVRHWLYAIYS